MGSAWSAVPVIIHPHLKPDQLTQPHTNQDKISTNRYTDRKVSRVQTVGFGLTIIRAASKIQNVKNNVLREKPEECPPSLVHQPKHSNKAQNFVDSEQNHQNR